MLYGTEYVEWVKVLDTLAVKTGDAGDIEKGDYVYDGVFSQRWLLVKEKQFRPFRGQAGEELTFDFNPNNNHKAIYYKGQPNTIFLSRHVPVSRFLKKLAEDQK